jgi:hypothetical protein
MLIFAFLVAAIYCFNITLRQKKIIHVFLAKTFKQRTNPGQRAFIKKDM